jgi:predicted Zn-dependent protease
LEILAQPKRRLDDERTAAGPRKKTERRLNVRLALISLAVLAVAAPSAYFWRSNRLANMADAWLARADELVEQNQPRVATVYLRRYLHLHPDDTAVHIRTAQLLDQSAKSDNERQAAVAQHYLALGLAPERNDLRRRLVELLFQTSQFAAAELEANKFNAELIKAGAKADPGAQRVLALAALRKSKAGDGTARRQAFEQIKQILVEKPGDIELAAALANLYRTFWADLGLIAKDAAQEADAVMERMIAANAADARAFLNRFLYRRQFNLSGSHQDLERAVMLGPKDAITQLIAGEYFLDSANSHRDLQRARECFQRAITVAPNSEQAYLGLGRTHEAAGDLTLAIGVWTDGLKHSNEHSVDLNSSLVTAYATNRQLPEAQQALARLRRGVDSARLAVSAAGRLALRNQVTRLEAQLHLARGEWARAIPLLRQVLDSSSSGAGVSIAENEIERARTLLAQVYMQTECWDLAAAECDQLAQAAQSDWRRQFDAGEAWRRAGQFDRAIECYERAASLKGAPASLWIGIAQTHLDQQSLRPDPKLRDWQAFRRAFEQARKDNAGAWPLRLIAAQWQASQVDTEAGRVKAVELLKAGEKPHGDQPEYWARLVTAYEGLKQPADADRALARFTELDRRSIASKLLRVELLALRKQFDEAEKHLALAIANAPEGSRPRLLHRQMKLAFESRRTDVGRQRITELVRLEPTNIRLLRQAADLAIDASDFAEVERLSAALEAVEGATGPMFLFVRARKQLLESARAKTEPPAEVDRIVAQLLAGRPNWAPAVSLAAHLAERRGNVKLATSHYEKAIELGDRRLATYERLMLLLFGQNRLAEAQTYLDGMGRAALSSERLESIAMMVAARQDQRERALQLAQESVKQHPQDAMRRLWLGQMFQLSDRRNEAHQALREAVQLAPTDARTYNAIFSYYRRIGDLTAAETTLKELGEKAKLEPHQRAFALGQGYELIGKRKEAEDFYRQANKLSPKDTNAAVRLAALVAARDIDEAKSILQEVIKLDSTAHAARRALAVLLASRGGDSAFAEAQELLKSSSGDEAGSAENDRLRAVLLVNQGRTRKERLNSYAQAREAIESVMDRTKNAEPADRLILAGLFEGEAKWLEDPEKLHLAREQFRPLVEAAEPAEANLRLYADFLLRHAGGKLLSASRQKEDLKQVFLADAERQIQRLEARERRDKRFPTSQTLLMRARWLVLNNRAEEIPPTLNPAAEARLASLGKDDARLQFMLEVGQVFSAVELEPQAETWYRKALAASPRSYVALAQCLARQGKLPEAVALCQEAAKADANPQPAIVAANLLTAHGAGKKDSRQIEPLLTDAVSRHPTNAELLFAVAILRTVQDRTDDAIGLFERLVAAAPKHALGLNNLATLLAEQPGRQGEALKHIDQAIELVGRQGALLDTKGTVLLLEGKVAEAIVCLEEAVESVAADPRYSFHLAAAYQRIGRTADAKVAFQRALENGLDKQVLTSGDRQFRTQLEKIL